VTAVRVIVGASHAYACITGPGYSSDVRLSPGKSVVNSLRETLAEMDADIAKRQKRAARIADAIAHLSDAPQVTP
jgi:hypothetical protein